jgi:hypothetical protein
MIVIITTKDKLRVRGSVHGSGGVMRGTDTLDRLRLAIERANDGEDIGIYMPLPGHARMYIDDNSDDRFDVDLRGATVEADPMKITEDDVRRVPVETDVSPLGPYLPVVERKKKA